MRPLVMPLQSPFFLNSPPAPSQVALHLLVCTRVFFACVNSLGFFSVPSLTPVSLLPLGPPSWVSSFTSIGTSNFHFFWNRRSPSGVLLSSLFSVPVTTVHALRRKGPCPSSREQRCIMFLSVIHPDSSEASLDQRSLPFFRPGLPFQPAGSFHPPIFVRSAAPILQLSP